MRAIINKKEKLLPHPCFIITFRDNILRVLLRHLLRIKKIKELYKNILIKIFNTLIIKYFFNSQEMLEDTFCQQNELIIFLILMC